MTYGIIAGGVCIIILAAGKMNDVKNRDSQVKSTVEVKSPSVSKENMIGKVLQGDIYGQQLGELYSKHPEASEIILNREKYSDTLIDYLIRHEEALDWVIDYPNYMEKGAGELDKIALQPVELKDYYLQNGIPLFFQWDKTWGYSSYGTGQIAIDGCGPTALAMVVTGLKGDTSMTPKKIADFSAAEGYYTEDAGTDWSLMTEGAQKLGLTSKEVSWSESALIAELSAGHPVICSMGAGDFTDKGHFIVLTGLSPEGKVILNDPNSRVNSRKKWDIKKLMDQMKIMWSYQ